MDGSIDWLLYWCVVVDRAEQEVWGGAAEAATWSGRGSDPQRVADLSATQEIPRLRQRDVRPTRAAVQGQTKVSRLSTFLLTCDFLLPAKLSHVQSNASAAYMSASVWQNYSFRTGFCATLRYYKELIVFRNILIENCCLCLCIIKFVHKNCRA